MNNIIFLYMKNLRDTFKQFLNNDDIKNDLKEIMMKPVFNMIYNEIYIYIWIIAIYNIFFVFIILAIFFILLKIINSKIFYSDI